MLINTDAVAALDAANAAIAAVMPRQRRALLVEFYLRDAVRPSRGVRLRDLPASLRPQSGACIVSGVLKADGTGGWYLDLAELQAQQRRCKRRETAALLMMMAVVSVGTLLLAQ